MALVDPDQQQSVGLHVDYKKWFAVPVSVSLRWLLIEVRDGLVWCVASQVMMASSNVASVEHVLYRIGLVPKWTLYRTGPGTEINKYQTGPGTEPASKYRNGSIRYRYDHYRIGHVPNWA